MLRNPSVSVLFLQEEVLWDPIGTMSLGHAIERRRTGSSSAKRCVTLPTGDYYNSSSKCFDPLVKEVATVHNGNAAKGALLGPLQAVRTRERGNDCRIEE